MQASPDGLGGPKGMDLAQCTRFAEDTCCREKPLAEKLGLAKPS